MCVHMIPIYHSVVSFTSCLCLLVPTYLIRGHILLLFFLPIGRSTTHPPHNATHRPHDKAYIGEDIQTAPLNRTKKERNENEQEIE